MTDYYPCGICEKSINDNRESSILCGLCNFWIHPKCNKLNSLDLQYISGSNEPWFCFKSNSTIFPFCISNNQNFKTFISYSTNLNTSSFTDNTNSSLILKPPPNLSLLFNQLRTLINFLINMHPIKN